MSPSYRLAWTQLHKNETVALCVEICYDKQPNLNDLMHLLFRAEAVRQDLADVRG